MPCLQGRAKHTLCKLGCQTDCLCCKGKTTAYACKPLCCGDYEINEIKGYSGWTGESNWTHLLFFRTQDGIGNNLFNPLQGASDSTLNTLASNGFGDGVSAPANRTPNPRFVSNAVSAFSGPDDHPTLNTMVTWWGQYIDHTLAITPETTDLLNILTAANSTEDPNEMFFNETIHFARAAFLPGSTPRQFITELTSFLDGDNVYGKDGPREIGLRLMDGSGHLRTSTGNLGPFNSFGLPNANPTGLQEDDLFLFGDVRGNENPGLISLHTMFVRLHNMLADEFVGELPQFAGQDEVIYQQARRLLSGIQQHITFTEYLPRVLGTFAPPAYSGYNENADPSILKEFSTVAYRALGHPSVQSVVELGDGSTNIDLTAGFFNPGFIVSNGIEDVVEGAIGQNMKNISTEVVDDLRNTLFGPPSGQVVLDLVTLNIQRGRDMGIPGYNTLRADYGLAPKATWADVTPDTALQARLLSVYPSGPANADPFIAGLAEPHVPGGVIGELFATIIREQFVRVRDGDRFWFENDPALRQQDIDYIKSFTFARVIELTTGLSVSGNGFEV
jgi:hypothetical protein